MAMFVRFGEHHLNWAGSIVVGVFAGGFFGLVMGRWAVRQQTRALATHWLRQYVVMRRWAIPFFVLLLVLYVVFVATLSLWWLSGVLMCVVMIVAMLLLPRRLKQRIALRQE